MRKYLDRVAWRYVGLMYLLISISSVIISLTHDGNYLFNLLGSIGVLSFFAIPSVIALMSGWEPNRKEENLKCPHCGK